MPRSGAGQCAQYLSLIHIFSGFEEDQYYTMEKFDDYWGGWKDNQIDKIQTLIVKDNATQIQMLNSGEVDKLQIPITENLDILEANRCV